MGTPYQWTKQVASHWGGTRNGTIVHWPGGIEATGELRHQFHHVIDVAPTVLEAAGLPFPTIVNGVLQEPLHGVAHGYCFDDAAAAERHETQYFEMMCNRGIYHKGWTAVTQHGTPWEFIGRTACCSDDVWELYDTPGLDPGPRPRRQTADKLAELQRLFEIEATKYNVLPLDDRMAERFNPETRRPPRSVEGTTQLLFGGMHRLQENAVINIKNKSHTVTAEIDVPGEGAERRDRRPGRAAPAAGPSTSTRAACGTCYNFVGAELRYATADRPLPAGTHQVRMEFAYDGGGVGKGGDVTLYVDGEQVGTGRVRRPTRSSSRWTRPSTSAATPARPSPRTTARRQRVHRHRRLGPDRRRRRRPRPPPLPRRAPPPRHGQAIARFTASPVRASARASAGGRPTGPSGTSASRCPRAGRW